MQRDQQTRRALGSEAFVTLVTNDHDNVGAIFDRIWQTIEEFEQRFSRFRPDSELTRINERAGRKTPASPPMIELLRTAKSMALETDGLYNPFVLPALQRAGYLGSWDAPKTGRISFEHRSIANANDLVIYEDAVKLPKDSALDLGGIGKGYLLDELADMLDTLQLAGYWISLGGDIVCAGADISGPWTIGIAGALQADKAVAEVTVPPGQRLAIATSGTTKRHGIKDNQPWHHLIDPRTGQSAATDILTATIVAPSATHADVDAKCLLILGSAKIDTFTAKHPYILGLAVQSSSDRPAPSIQTQGLIEQLPHAAS